MVQIEHAEAVKNVEDILSVEGIDGYFIGPSDLAISMGFKPGFDQSDPRHEEAVQRVLAVGKKLGVPGGPHVGSAEALNQRVAQGFRFIGLSSDEGFLRVAATSALQSVKR